VKKVPPIYKITYKITLVVLYISEVSSVCFMEENEVFSAE
jgi:hypothetical protein